MRRSMCVRCVQKHHSVQRMGALARFAKTVQLRKRYGYCALGVKLLGACAQIWVVAHGNWVAMRAAANRSLALSWDIVAMRRHCEALLSRLVGRCGHICCACSRINGVCFARTFLGPLQPFCLVTRHTAFQDTLIHPLKQPLLLGLSVAAANVFVHQRVIQHGLATLRALSARQQCFLTLHKLCRHHGCDQDRTVAGLYF